MVRINYDKLAGLCYALHLCCWKLRRVNVAKRDDYQLSVIQDVYILCHWVTGDIGPTVITHIAKARHHFKVTYFVYTNLLLLICAPYCINHISFFLYSMCIQKKNEFISEPVNRHIFVLSLLNHGNISSVYAVIVEWGLPEGISSNRVRVFMFYQRFHRNN